MWNVRNWDREEEDVRSERVVDLVCEAMARTKGRSD
jgi:hypothetical protein